MSEALSRVVMTFEKKPALWLRFRLMLFLTKGDIHYMWNAERTELVLWLKPEEVDMVINGITMMQKVG